jgi:hypothetical protein
MEKCALARWNELVDEYDVQAILNDKRVDPAAKEAIIKTAEDAHAERFMIKFAELTADILATKLAAEQAYEEEEEYYDEDEDEEENSMRI